MQRKFHVDDPKSKYCVNGSRGHHDVLASWSWITLISLILFENLFKPRQLRLAVYVTDFVVLSTTSSGKMPMASFLVSSLIFIEYEHV